MYNCSYRNISCADAGLLIKERPSIQPPAKRVQTVRVAGRDGELVIDDGLYDSLVISVKFNFLTKTPAQWMEAFRAAKDWLSGHGELWFSDDPHWFYRVNYIQITDTERTTRRLGNFTAEFHCEPYMYSREGQKIADIADGTLYNPHMTSHPLIYITGTGTGTLTINNKSVDFSSEAIGVLSGQLSIDTDLMRTMNYSHPANDAISGDYANLYLRPGMNYISITTGFDLQIVPRWRTI